MNRLALFAEQIKGKETVSVTDSRTGKTYELPVKNSFINSNDVTKIVIKESH
jgi:hypothetical protein